jgi:predicted amidophosphoribosyltransferase
MNMFWNNLRQTIWTLQGKSFYICPKCGKVIDSIEDKRYDGWCKRCFQEGVRRHSPWSISKEWLKLIDAPNFSELYPSYLAKRRQMIEGVDN